MLFRSGCSTVIFVPAAIIIKLGCMQTESAQPLDAGVFLIDKPAGPTSFRMVHLVRRALRIKKVGHAGTLDPFASGLLIVCAGRPATKLIPRMMAGEKEYEATLRLGVETDTHDLTGQVIAERDVGLIDQARVSDCLAAFVGKQMQIPPRFAALKHNGKPLYYYARKGIEVVKAPREIEIFDLDLLALSEKSLSIRVVCSKGTYIRSLASDIGAFLGCGAHLTSLRRTRSGAFSVMDALSGRELDKHDEAQAMLLDHMIEVEKVVTHLTN